MEEGTSQSSGVESSEKKDENVKLKKKRWECEVWESKKKTMRMPSLKKNYENAKLENVKLKNLW